MLGAKSGHHPAWPAPGRPEIDQATRTSSFEVACSVSASFSIEGRLETAAPWCRRRQVGLGASIGRRGSWFFWPGKTGATMWIQRSVIFVASRGDFWRRLRVHGYVYLSACCRAACKRWAGCEVNALGVVTFEACERALPFHVVCRECDPQQHGHRPADLFLDLRRKGPCDYMRRP